MIYPPVIVVDEQDNEIGSAMLAEVWRKGLYHRIVAVFVMDDTGRMLLQLRGPRVGVYPDCWDQAAGGHVDEGQTYDDAARNELAEEVGLHDIALTVLETYRSNERDGDRIINRFERIYVATIPHGTDLHPEAQEITELRWFTPEALRAAVAQTPERFTPGLVRALRQHYPSFIG